MGSSDSEVERETRIARESKMLDWVSSFIPFEAPRHSAVLTKPYAIGIYEVTRGQYRRFVEATGYLTDAERSPKGGTGFRNGMLSDSPDFNWKTDLGFQPPQTDESPVVNVSWDDVTQFCQWLSQKEGQTYRLPHEAEWEFACRGGNPGRFSFGDDAQKIHEYAWVGDGTSRGAIQVGQRKPNALGLFDMQGNVWEFCQDWHGSYPVDAVTDPTGPPGGSNRVGRGGTWGSYAELCRSAYRSSGNSGAYSSGFRVVRTLSIGTDGKAAQNGD